MFGEINAWFYKGLAGIFPDENQPGFKNVILKPNFVSGLKQFEARQRWSLWNHCFVMGEIGEKSLI